MNARRDISLSKWLVAAAMVALAQVAIAPRAAQARCGDYVMLGGHAAHEALMAKAVEYVDLRHESTSARRTVGQPDAAPIATFKLPPDPGSIHNLPLRRAHCSGPMCSNDNPRPLSAPPAPAETEVRESGLRAVQWLQGSAGPQFVRFADVASRTRIADSSVYRPPR